jgi:predicted nucleic acid-binding protein
VGRLSSTPGVFGATMTSEARPLASGYKPLLEGRRSIISFITVAELRFGGTVAKWGPKRLQRLEDKLNGARVVWPIPGLVDTYVKLRAWCVENGHGLHQKNHEADRWIAATAIHDGIFFNVKDLKLITKLPKLGVPSVDDDASGTHR